MNKYCLISVRPEHAINILNGKKTIELRKVVLKWVLEEVAKGNTVKFLMYVTKAKPYLTNVCIDEHYNTRYELFNIPHFGDVDLNGKVVASFDVSKIEDVYFNLSHWRFEANANGIDLTVDSCVTQNEIEKYFRLFSGSGKHYGYALHISNLNVFDKPKELSEFRIKDVSQWKNEIDDCFKVNRAPQNMMTVWGE